MSNEQDSISLVPMTDGMYHIFFREYENDPCLLLPGQEYVRYVYSEQKASAYAKRQHEPGRIPLAIMYEDEIAGEIIIKSIEPRKCATMSITLKNPGFTDRGIGTAAEKLAVRYVFEELDIPLLYADTLRSNTRSAHVPEKAGFILIREDKDYRYYRADREMTEEALRSRRRNMAGTSEMTTQRLLLRRYRPEDARTLHEKFGRDPEMYEYSGWNPYATAEMAEDTVRGFIGSYDDESFYGWAIEYRGELIGTIGAYDYDPVTNTVETGMSIERACWGRGFATEALTAVLTYLTEHEGIGNVTAWCASDNTGSKRALEKAGMKQVSSEKDALEIDGKKYDRLVYRYPADKPSCL